MKMLQGDVDELAEKVFESAFLAKPLYDRGTGGDHRIYTHQSLRIEYDPILTGGPLKRNGPFKGRVGAVYQGVEVFLALLRFVNVDYNFTRTLVETKVDKYISGDWEKIIDRLYNQRCRRVEQILKTFPTHLPHW